MPDEQVLGPLLLLNERVNCLACVEHYILVYIFQASYYEVYHPVARHEEAFSNGTADPNLPQIYKRFLQHLVIKLVSLYHIQRILMAFIN